MPLRAPEDTGDNAIPQTNGHGINNDNSIRPICAAIAARVNAFLDEKAETELLRTVQVQTRIALGVIKEALEKYRLVF
jgi:FAD synthetase